MDHQDIESRDPVGERKGQHMLSAAQLGRFLEPFYCCLSVTASQDFSDQQIEINKLFSIVCWGTQNNFWEFSMPTKNVNDLFEFLVNKFFDGLSAAGFQAQCSSKVQERNRFFFFFPFLFNSVSHSTTVMDK